MFNATYSQRGTKRVLHPRLLIWPLAAIALIFLLVSTFRRHTPENRPASALVQQHIDHSAGTGGRKLTCMLADRPLR